MTIKCSYEHLSFAVRKSNCHWFIVMDACLSFFLARVNELAWTRQLVTLLFILAFIRSMVKAWTCQWVHCERWLEFLRPVSIKQIRNEQLYTSRRRRISKWANEQVSKWANGQMNKWTNEQMNKCNIHLAQEHSIGLKGTINTKDQDHYQEVNTKRVNKPLVTTVSTDARVAVCLLMQGLCIYLCLSFPCLVIHFNVDPAGFEGNA